MRKPVKLRTLTAEEVTEVKRLTSSRKEPIRLVQRARIIAFMLKDSSLYASDGGLRAGYSSVVTGPVWVQRFNEKGLAGLEDQPRLGHKPTYGQEVHSQLVSLATQKPRGLGYPFELWTLKRLQTAFQERHGIHLCDSTIWEWLDAEGLEWKRQGSWFHEAEKHEPEFVEKRGAS